MKILNIALPVPLRKTFDYLSTDDVDTALLQPGMRIQVPFQGRKLVGVYLGVTEQTNIELKRLKAIEAVLDIKPVLPSDIMKLCAWAAEYYHYPLGEVLHAALPAALRKGKAEIEPVVKKATSKILDPLLLNEKQNEVVQAVANNLNKFSVFTVDGVTGSGKTEVYLQIIQKVLAQNKQTLILVPEINLTPQMIARFKERFAVPIMALNSGLTEKTRLNAWLAAKAGAAAIIIGTRSAIFTALANPGLIIVDEEHDASFKQQDTFRYNARDLAIWRAKDANVPVVLGSATLSLETLYRAGQGSYQYFHLPERAGGAALPQFNIIDVRRKDLNAGLSVELLQAMHTQLQAGNQVMLFLNRRGFSPVLMCHACGWTATCRHCDARMTYHLSPLRLHCHHCESQKPVMQHCEGCGAKELQALGVGTEKLEQVLQQHFPHFPLARIDRDSTRRKGKIDEMLQGIHEGKYKILIGTQMLAKGHHFPDVTLVGVIDSDAGLFSSDFRASERLGQLILQVAGRAGRASKPGIVSIQTHHPEHPLLQLLRAGNYQEFAKTLLNEREMAQLPPYAAMALFHAEAHKLVAVETFLEEVKQVALALKTPVIIRGPVPALMSRRAGRYRMQLIFQADHKKDLQPFLRGLLQKVEAFPSKLKIHWSVDVDPVEVL
ncbi:MAG TPA: primosomal protein N' [Gammaproteobacteria bacterium]|nr:primosomal protein N' [Gammaproteobacteria bacterium]